MNRQDRHLVRKKTVSKVFLPPLPVRQMADRTPPDASVGFCASLQHDYKTERPQDKKAGKSRLLCSPGRARTYDPRINSPLL
jgi:hypothetical protein